MTARRIMRGIIRFLFKVLARVEVSGLENIPPTGGCILCANHLGIIDSAFVFIILEREDVTGFVAEKYQKNIFVSWLVRIVHGIWLNRGEADTEAIRRARERLQQGWGLGIAPEGTRSKTGALTPGKSGVAFLAAKTGVPVVPMAITGTEKIFSEFRRLRRPRLTLTVGKPFFLPGFERQDREVALLRNTEEIMCRIAAMLPARYRGVYAQHPRLLELLTDQA